MDAETSECVPFLQASPQQHPSKTRLPSPDIDRPFNPPSHPEPPKYDPNTKSKILKSNEDLYSHKSTFHGDLRSLVLTDHFPAAGAWDQIYILFREDHSLLNKKDFISGYTVLHWIAKHGDHRVLNTLCYGVNKRGLALDVNVKSSCGYTALHLAAIHGHKSIIRLLVHKYKANVNLRDTSGKKPWHYLDRREFTGDLGVLLGAPSSKNTAAAAYQSASEKQDLSFSPSVKRNTSFAAFLRPHHLWKGAQF
ncbi:Ankyrin repeat domain-containing protein SOWAHB [Acipenser ruthenus]|uniref:Ankyrin repeat domain-containing protein SOWAHB n=1 Tax=Acipenser ruthenus TaxID=7906 RepID=A0A444UT14_ACIRT|nr:Ankyrin repeat domain-containing protein SOWAHB [Acipenser ruthenus]